MESTHYHYQKLLVKCSCICLAKYNRNLFEFCFVLFFDLPIIFLSLLNLFGIGVLTFFGWLSFLDPSLEQLHEPRDGYVTKAWQPWLSTALATGSSRGMGRTKARYSVFPVIPLNKQVLSFGVLNGMICILHEGSLW